MPACQARQGSRDSASSLHLLHDSRLIQDILWRNVACSLPTASYLTTTAPAQAASQNQPLRARQPNQPLAVVLDLTFCFTDSRFSL